MFTRRPNAPITAAYADALNACGRFLSVSVLRDASLSGDCTAGGVSSRQTRLYIPCPGGNWTRADIVRMGEGERILSVLPPAFEGCPLRVKPESIGGRHSMFGGNYITASDSRYSEAYAHPLAIHDRVEG